MRKLIAVAALALVGLVAACSGSGDGPARSAERQQINHEVQQDKQAWARADVTVFYPADIYDSVCVKAHLSAYYTTPQEWVQVEDRTASNGNPGAVAEQQHLSDCRLP
jgi:hypothetical protein